MAAARGSLRCTLTALLWAWVTMVFATSALVALLVAPNDTITAIVAERGPVGATVRLADEMGPAVKLLLIAVFALLVLLGERVAARPVAARYALNAALGAAAMLLVLAVVPASFSRGFGVGLTGQRFHASLLPIYLTCGALAGLAFTHSATVCRRRLVTPAVA
jgi:hypothetical protein